jgi:hypothetical protein
MPSASVYILHDVKTTFEIATLYFVLTSCSEVSKRATFCAAFMAVLKLLKQL